MVTQNEAMPQTVEQLLIQLHQHGVKLWVENGRLYSQAPKGGIPTALRAEIRRRKAQIITFLEEAQSATSQTSAGQPAPTIKPAPRNEPIPLSFAQQRLWFLDQLEGEANPTYIIPAAYRLSGSLRIDLLSQALNAIVQRHESLRTTFPALEGKPIQQIHPPCHVDCGGISLSIIELSHLPAHTQRQELEQRLLDETLLPFNLTTGPLLRATLYVLGKSEHVLLLTMHHIISDGWSLTRFMQELDRLYGAFAAGDASPLPPLPIQYADYTLWQRQWLQGERLDAQTAYWKQKLHSAPTQLELPTDYPRPSIQGYRGRMERFAIDPQLTAQLRALSREHEATLFMTLLAAFAVLLARVSGQDELIIGTPIANRNHPDLEPLIGFFINTLALRIDLRTLEVITTVELLQQIRQTTLEAFAHQELPFEQVIQEVGITRHLSHAPLVQVMFALENNQAARGTLGDLTTEPLALDMQVAKFDLSLMLDESGRGLSGTIEYNVELFTPATIQRMIGHFQTLLAGIIADPQRSITHLPLLTEPERHQILVEWNDTTTDYPKNKCIHELFEQQVAHTPDAIAVVFGNQQLTYPELNERANQLAHHLQSIGVGAETLVGICVERGIRMIVGLLGILKAGGAYVPLDIAYPEERLAFMLQDTQVPVLLTEQRLTHLFSNASATVVSLDTGWGEITNYPVTNLKTEITSQSPAYIIYTSGSTGIPKGVTIPHRGINRLLFNTNYIDIWATDRIAQASNASFDAATFEIWGALAHGATLVGIPREVALVPQEFVAYLHKEEISVLFLTTALFNQIVRAVPDAFAKLRYLLFGGEAVDPTTVRMVVQQGAPTHLLHVYGPTESTTYSTWYSVQDVPAAARTVPIGKPLANSQIYVLDRYLQPVAVNIPGVLYIGGDGLALEYHNRPELTAERFIANPFGSGRLYNTGDLVRWLPASRGNIEFLGRIDNQVKIRGFRIELGEIEAVLTDHPSVQDAVVLARQDENALGATDKRLVAYLVLASEADHKHPEDALTFVREYLRSKLPDYMVPKACVLLSALPLTPNGKVDRRALPAPNLSIDEERYVAPRTPTEEQLVAIWSEVLAVGQVSTADNFFDLGGHSLLVTQILARVRSAFQVELPVRTLFEAATVADFALAIEEAIEEARTAQKVPLVLPPIPPVDRSGTLPLSFAQQRLWFLGQLEGMSDVYNIPVAFCLVGPLDVAALNASWQAICERHEALRTTFGQVDGQAYQQINPISGQLELIDLSELPKDQQESDVARLSLNSATRPFDLTNGPLWRVSLLRLGREDHLLLITIHHIISDGWSMGILMRELSALYNNQLRHARSNALDHTRQPNRLPELPVQYADFAVWQRSWLTGDLLEQQLAYWKEQLADAPPLLTLPTDHARPAVQSYRGDSLSFTLSGTLHAELKRLSDSNSTTLFMTLQAAFALLLSRYSGQEDILIGTPTSNRQVAEVEGLIGFFVNTLVLRNDLSAENGTSPTFRDLLTRVRRVALDAYQHQGVPFELLVNTLQPERSLSHSPLFQVMFSLENNRQEELSIPDITVTPLDLEYPIAKFDLTLFMEQHGESLIASWEYNTDLFERATIERMAGHFQTLLEGIVANPNQPIADLPLLTMAERHQLLVEWNDTATDYPSDACLHQLFEEQVERTPDAVAVVFGEKKVTYHELNTRANQLAHYLIAQGVGPDVLVGICVERSIEMVVGLLGILKAGGAYVPLDPHYPAQRLAFMFSDAQVKLTLTQASLPLSILSKQTVLDLESNWPPSSLCPENPSVEVEPTNLAYVIYTSGSTGRPKGVQICHRAICNHMFWIQKTFAFAPSDKVLQKTPFSFDASVWEFYAPLLVGGQLVIARPFGHQDSSYMVEILQSEKITILQLVPTQLRMLVETGGLEHCHSLKHLFCGGEALPMELVRRFKNLNGAQVTNLYGPTEACIDATFWVVKDKSEMIPIGRPIGNYQVYVLDEHLQPVPIGAPGELHIGGAGLARGYLNRPQLTSEKFIPNPFGPGRLYKTGDLCRYLPDGNIEFLGRIDHQVKIRGFRIELGEIEAVLNSQVGVREAVVVVREEASGKRLVAYVVGDAPAKGLRAALSDKLPDYMIPSAFVPLSAMPLTPNGKIDRRALPAPEIEVDSAQLVLPRTPHETILAAIWQELLGLKQVGIHDNFFEIGGHSLLATQVVSRIRQNLQVELPLRRLFSAPTIAELAQQLNSGAKVNFGEESVLPPLEPLDQKDHLPLSFAQQRLWFLGQLEGISDVYNIPVAFCLVGPLDVAALSASWQAICQRHEALRTSFPQVDGQAYQQINPTSGKLELIDLSDLPKDQQEADVARLSLNSATRPFDLTNGPLWRVSLLRLGREDHLLLITMHHIISDGWSMGILMRELSALYNNQLRHARSNALDHTRQPNRLPELPVQYADFAVWQRSWLTGDLLEQQLAYWKEQLADAPPLLTLPTDRPRPAVQSYRGDSLSFTLSGTLHAELKRLSDSNSTTLFMTLQAAFALLLSRYSGQEDILIGTPIANRQVAEVEGLIGFFVNTLVLRNDLSGNPTGTPARLTFRDVLERVRQVTLDAYQHQALPFELLVETVQPERSLSHSPLFQVGFTLENNRQEGLSFSDVTATPIEVEYPIAKYDILLAMQENKSGLIAWWEYNTDLFERATIERMGGHFQTLLAGIVANPLKPIALLPLLTTAERDQLLVEWNDTATDYPSDKCIHQLFEEQVARTPSAIAIVFDDQQLTYHELNRRANQLAHYLQAQGVGADVLVAICVERSVEMVVGLLGVLKAGGAYLPLDPTYPPERLSFMLEDAMVSILLTQERFGASWPQVSRQLCLDQESLYENEPDSNPLTRVKPNHLAYCIYTSGSTGLPKGVLVEHRGVPNLARAQIEAFAIGSDSRVLQFASFSFDASVSEIFTTLLTGAQLVIPSPNTLLAGPSLHKLLQEQRITVVTLPPSVLSTLPPLELRTLVVAGEACPSAVAKQWLSGKSQMTPTCDRFINAYGPTEATVCATMRRLTLAQISSNSLPIGQPIANTQIYILDRHQKVVPILVAGELYIGGVGVARGYLNRPQLTSEKFIPNPFGPGRLYKTGDLCRYLPDGNIEFLGRTDYQVKIRGFRIELGEIEAALNSEPNVRETVVVAREEPSGKRLVAYVVGDAPAKGLRAALSDKLPDYMIPSVFMQLESMPQSPNGKIDRRALPAPEIEVDSAQLVLPRTPVETILAQLFGSILSLDQVGVHDSFFDLGGHSLLLTQLFFRLRECFQVEFTLQDLFASPTVAELATAIDAKHQGELLDQSIDLAAEAVLDSTIVPTQTRLRPKALLDRSSSFFLTGATGFLGGFLLYELLEQTPAILHCLVRCANQEQGMIRLQNNLKRSRLWKDEFADRLICVPGDLSRPLFGLTPAEFHDLSSQVDVIYHNGAQVNFLKPYEALKPANVLGSQEVLRLAVQDLPIPVHYVSTLSIFDSINDSNGRRIDEESDLGNADGLLGGYAQSKWVANKLMIEARNRGIPVTIYRPGLICGHSQTGTWHTDDFFCRWLKACIQLGACPQEEESLYLTPVDYVSSAIVALSRDSANQNRIFHLTNPYSLQSHQLTELLRAFGYPMREIYLQEWLKELTEAVSRSTDNALTPLLPLLVTPISGPDSRILLEIKLEHTFDCTKTLAALAHTNIVCPQVDAVQFRTYLSYFIDTGFLEAPEPLLT